MSDGFTLHQFDAFHVTFIFHSFSNSLARLRYLSFFLNSFNFILWSAETAKSTILQILFFFCWLLFGLIFWLRLGDLSIYQSPRGVYVCHFLGQLLGCVYHLFVWSNLNFLHISQWITLPTQSCLVSYSFCANLLHSLIMWLMVSSLSPTFTILLRLIYSRFDMIGSYGVYYYYYYYYYNYFISSFHSNISLWAFTGIWFGASFLMSPGLFSVFQLISAMLLSEWFLFSHWFPVPSVTSPGSCWPFQVHNYNYNYLDHHVPQLLQFSGKVQVFVYLFAFFYFHSVLSWNSKINKTANSLFS